MPQSYLDSQSTYVDKDNMVGARKVTTTAADTLTLTPEDSFGITYCTKGSATQVITLPSAATAGLQFTFMCGHASGEILVNPATGEKIVGITQKTVGADSDTEAISNTTTGIKNTAATNVIGDSLTLVSNGVDTWVICPFPSGIWASQ